MSQEQTTPQPVPPTKPVKKPMNKGCMVGLGIFGAAMLIIIIVALATCGGSSPSSTTTTFTTTKAPAYTGPEVRYEITGTASAVSITMQNSTGGTEQIDKVYLPWNRDFSKFDGRFVYISAQNQGETGSVTASIYVNGKLFKTSTSSGQYVIATASGSK